METTYSERIVEIKREKEFLEEKLKVEIVITGKKIELNGDAFDEYEALRVMEAIDIGFSARTAVQILEEETGFEKLNIKDFTRRKDLEAVRARIIGSNGKTKRTLEELSGSKIMIKDNHIGIIGPAESMPATITAITNVVKGTKQANAYYYLEKINTGKKKTE